ncbi:hypothetical protein HID58_039007 [Brassica napus]|uniref:Uncharacterized protein n=1 Tax=Brassica napus TaxID=3708 RepID=A0ABQ8BSG2_BRANA|nr:hypothetical protein HID58_039007 [Brassica napus]
MLLLSLSSSLGWSVINLQGDAGVRDEETVRIQYLAEIAKFLGFTPTVDIEAIQGHGTYEDRMEMLRNIVDLVEASLFSDNPEWRPEVSELETKLSEQAKILSNLQQKVDDLAAKFLANLKNLRDSHAALSIGSSGGTVAGEPSSVTRIVSECESALTVLNRDLGILSASIARL